MGSKKQWDSLKNTKIDWDSIKRCPHCKKESCNCYYGDNPFNW
jgi:hypothetical protein